MTEQQKSLVRESFAGLKEISGPVALLFYGRLFDLDPRLRALFPSDMKTQGQKLMSMFDSIVKGLEQPEAMQAELRELGRKHAGYGVKLEYYDTLTRAFLWSLTQAMEGGFTPEARDAWESLILGINEQMKAGAAEVSAAPAESGTRQNP